MCGIGMAAHSLRDPQTAHAVVSLLDELPFFVGLQSSDVNVRVKTLAALSKRAYLSSQMIERVAGRIMDSDQVVCVEAELLLRKVGERAVPPLVRAISGSQEKERIAGLIVLQGLGERSRPALLEIAKVATDKSSSVRARAMAALGATGDHRAVVHLIQGLRDKDEVVKRESACGLGHLGPVAKEAIPEVSRVAKHYLSQGDDEYRVGESAMGALHGIGVASVPTLEAIARDSTNNSDLRGAALEVIGQMAPDSAAALPCLVKILQDRDKQLSDLARDMLRRFGPAAKVALPVLAEGLKDRSDYARVKSAATLYAINPQDTRVIKVLVDCLSSGDADARRHACDELGMIGKPVADAIPSVEKCLKDPRAEVRRMAALSLLRFGPLAARSEAALSECLTDPDENVRESAGHALRSIRRK
jgi:HEAT repeat protein